MFFALTLTALNALTGMEVGNYRLQSGMHNESFSYWCVQRLGLIESELGPKHNESTGVNQNDGQRLIDLLHR